VSRSIKKKDLIFISIGLSNIYYEYWLSIIILKN
jgi:hypothetical protein